MTGELLTPRKPNGRVDWFAYLRTTWPVAMAVVGLVFWLGGRLQSPSEKQAQVQQILEPVKAELLFLRERLDRHVELGGHAAMRERMARVEEKLNE